MAGNELQKTVEKPVVALLAKYKGQIEAILPKHLTPERVLKMIVGELNRNPKLLECTPWSVVNSVLTLSMLGLEVRPGSAYLIPFRDRRGQGTPRTICTPVIDYRGKIDLARRSGVVEDVDAEIVFSKDKFRIFRNEFGFKILEHEPLLYRKNDQTGDMIAISDADRGEPIGAYAVAVLKHGQRPKFTFMPKVDILAIKNRSRAKDDGPWVTDELEMWKKTVIHRQCKTLPQTPELAKAQEIDDRAEVGINIDSVIDAAYEDAEDVKPILASSVQAAEEVGQKRIAELRGTNGAHVAGEEPSGSETSEPTEEEMRQWERDQLEREMNQEPAVPPPARRRSGLLK